MSILVYETIFNVKSSIFELRNCVAIFSNVFIELTQTGNVRSNYRRKLLHEPPTGDKEKQKNNYESDRKRISVFRRECV